MQYHDFSIKIEPGEGGAYDVIVLDSPAGQGRGTIELPFDPAETGTVLDQVATAVRSSSTSRHAAPASGGMTPRQVGDQLFRALMSGGVRTLYDRSMGRIEDRRDRGLRLKLHLDPEAPELMQLASLPWEYLYQAETRDFLNLNRLTPVVRFLDVPRPIRPLALEPPLRILVVVSSPAGVEPLDLARERAGIEAAWGQHPSVEVDFLDEATTAALRGRLLERPYHVLHYMGHGGFDEDTGRGVLLMEDENGTQDQVTGHALATMLRGVGSLRLVFLNACDTARTTAKAGLDPFAGVATALVMGGLPAVVAMQYPISDQAAVAFSEVFYPRLAAGDPVDAAVAEGRLAVFLDDSESLEWGTPVLFMRTPDGRLFEPASEAVPPSGKPVAVSARDERTPSRAGGGVGTPDGGAGAPGPGAPGTPGGGIAGRGRLLAAIALLVLVALGLWVVFGDDGAPPEPDDGAGTATPTATATATPTASPTATSSAVAPPRLLYPVPDATVKNHESAVPFEWTGELPDGAQYVLVIYHWNEDCRDVQCTEVIWQGRAKTYELARDSWFLWEENKRLDWQDRPVTWQVLVVSDNATRDPAHPPAEEHILTVSERRVIAIGP